MLNTVPIPFPYRNLFHVMHHFTSNSGFAKNPITLIKTFFCIDGSSFYWKIKGIFCSFLFPDIQLLTLEREDRIFS